jgi:DNA-binding transcriptional LysR family regulator
MEMHQIRYFLAVATEQNFSKAAEKCNVSQPSMSRAIKQLEGEFGGDLFRRERPQAQLTELGERMYPLMKQCYDSAIGARSLASSIKTSGLGSLRLALSHAIELELLIPHIIEVRRLFARLELKLMRGTSPEVLECLKNGEAELAVASGLSEEWERLDRWPLFNEPFHLVVNRRHELASRLAVDVEDLQRELVLRRRGCEHGDQMVTFIRASNLDVDFSHEIDLEQDLISLVEAGLGVAILPDSTSIPATLARTTVNGIDLRRTVYIYGVAGRERSPVASAILKMVRATDWSRTEIAATHARNCVDYARHKLPIEEVRPGES